MNKYLIGALVLFVLFVGFSSVKKPNANTNIGGQNTANIVDSVVSYEGEENYDLADLPPPPIWGRVLGA